MGYIVFCWSTQSSLFLTDTKNNPLQLQPILTCSTTARMATCIYSQHLCALKDLRIAGICSNHLPNFERGGVSLEQFLLAKEYNSGTSIALTANHDYTFSKRLEWTKYQEIYNLSLLHIWGSFYLGLCQFICINSLTWLYHSCYSLLLIRYPYYDVGICFPLAFTLFGLVHTKSSPT